MLEWGIVTVTGPGVGTTLGEVFIRMLFGPGT
jgi:hypothetical protein